jgi:hypothetical protein
MHKIRHGVMADFEKVWRRFSEKLMDGTKSCDLEFWGHDLEGRGKPKIAGRRNGFFTVMFLPVPIV